jgi:DNA-binding NarL/FixJ family response regulator
MLAASGRAFLPQGGTPPRSSGDSHAQPGPTPARDGPERDRPRVLVADDHGPMLGVLVQLLSTEYEVVAALLDGDAAIGAAARHAPDVVVLDIAMPRINGIAAALELRARGSDAKIVFVTMHPDPAYVAASLELGAVGFVVKSRLALDLLPALREVLAGRRYVSSLTGEG